MKTIYNIFLSHNKAWSIREIIFFVTIFALCMIVVCTLYCKDKIRLFQAYSFLLFVIYIAIVFASTVFTRTPDIKRDYELILFWSWKKSIYMKDKKLFIQILLNFILLFPLGVLVPFIFNTKVKLRKAFLYGSFISFCIEIMQLLLKRGLFEWDDIVHNSIGFLIGCIVSNAIFSCISNKKST